jgi:hypothetical protein
MTLTRIAFLLHHRISKTYSAFRTLASQLKKAAENKLDKDTATKESMTMLKFSQSVEYLVETQKTEYLGKVNYNYVKSLAKQRAQVLDDTLETILQNFPKSIESGSTIVRACAQIVENFLLTDHVQDSDELEESESGFLGRLKTPLKKGLLRRNKSDKSTDNHAPDLVPPPPEHKEATSITSPVVPLSRKTRRSLVVRANDDDYLSRIGEGANLMLDDDNGTPRLVPNYSKPLPTVNFGEGSTIGKLIESNPFVFLGIFATSAALLKAASLVSVTMDLDVGLLIGFALFCLGLHMPRPAQRGIDTPAVSPKPLVTFAPPPTKLSRDASATIRRSLILSPRASVGLLDEAATEMEVIGGEVDPLIQSPLPMFPKGAALGSQLNCWSLPTHESFQVRGSNYLADKVKVPSKEFLFPTRGVDLFLTDACPENVGAISGILGGTLREKPSFIINFRLPWGVFIAYFEIPAFFLPFIRKRYEFDYDEPLPDLDKMTPAERCACRFLHGDQATKNKTMKIVPVVVEGPWIVKSVVGGKPAIIGNKLPVNWVYEPASNGKALYLEADMDIVSSSAARGILSVARSHTNVLTLDLGFVVQGNAEDELPEQMMVGVRLHGIDPLTASPLPPMKNQYLHGDLNPEDDAISMSTSFG